MKQSVAVLCIPALRKFLSADGVLAARDAGRLDPQTGEISIPVEALKAITKAHRLKPRADPSSKRPDHTASTSIPTP